MDRDTILHAPAALKKIRESKVGKLLPAPWTARAIYGQTYMDPIYGIYAIHAISGPCGAVLCTRV